MASNLSLIFTAREINEMKEQGLLEGLSASESLETEITKEHERYLITLQPNSARQLLMKYQTFEVQKQESICLKLSRVGEQDELAKTF